MPDGSQARLDLERLQARYDQAPQSRLFAPLADAYRGAGQPDKAAAILRTGLERDPSYVSALVLLAQCSIDLQQEDAAEATFARVLELDPENLVALRFRAERARRRGALERAVEMLRLLLKIDPFDREVQADLGLVATALERKAREERPSTTPETTAWPPPPPVEVADKPITVRFEPRPEARPQESAEAPIAAASTPSPTPVQPDFMLTSERRIPPLDDVLRMLS